MLKRIILNGFTSIKEMDLELRPLNILIGANGAGKSNLVSFFKMLNEMMAGRLRQYIGISGRAQSLLHFGPKVTPQIEARLEFEGDNDTGTHAEGTRTYAMRLFHAAGDTLIYAEETLSWLQKGYPFPQVVSLGAGHQETRLREKADEREPTAKTLEYLLDRCRVYHFHDTSFTARVRQSSYIGDNRWLMSDAGNLAAFLFRLREENTSAYRRIVATIRLIAPFFDDFVLEPPSIGGSVILDWRQKGSDGVFGPHQLSDGTLRAICLITLLMQPEDELPEFILIDEPELGLHPYALNLVASMVGKVSHHTQVLVSTQSSSFLDNFDPEDVIVVNHSDNTSQFKRLSPTELEAWLEEYSLGEVWEKNVFGGGPR